MLGGSAPLYPPPPTPPPSPVCRIRPGRRLFVRASGSRFRHWKRLFLINPDFPPYKALDRVYDTLFVVAFCLFVRAVHHVIYVIPAGTWYTLLLSVFVCASLLLSFWKETRR